MAHAHQIAQVETIEEKNQWLIDHPEEEAKYPGEWIAVAGGRIVAHGKTFGEAYDDARKLGHDPYMALAYDPSADDL